jgi:hypothetical protein
MSEHMTPAEAQEALGAVARAQRQIADEVGLPRAYWWAMAAGWVVLGVIGEFGPVWLTSVATLLFGAAHAAFASRLLGGARRTGSVRVSATVAGRRTPLVVVGMLMGLVVLTIGAALVLDADGAEHAAVWAAVLIAAIIGLGGPEILRALRRWARA